jgi:uncharacterized damage-inducible protein DinB
MAQHLEVALLHESFKRNGRVNEVLLNTLSEADLMVSDEQGSWSVGQHLGHVAGCRYGWLRYHLKVHVEEIPSLVAGAENVWVAATTSVGEVRQALSMGDEAAVKAVMGALDEGRSFEGDYRSHPAHFLQHVLVHDAHHRGQVMSLLRKSGRTFEQMEELNDAMWSVWLE